MKKTSSAAGAGLLAWALLGRAFADTAQSAELATLLGALNAGQGINLYLRL